MVHETHPDIDQFRGQYRFTVTADDKKFDVGAIGPDSATHRTMTHFGMKTAKNVKVVSAEGQRVWYTNVQCLEHGHIAYETKQY